MRFAAQCQATDRDEAEVAKRETEARAHLARVRSEHRAPRADDADDVGAVGEERQEASASPAVGAAADATQTPVDAGGASSAPVALDAGETADGGRPRPVTGTCHPVVQPEARDLCSMDSRVSVPIHFVNNCLDTPVSVQWVDPQCREREYGRIAPGESVDVTSSVGHVWVARSLFTRHLLSISNALTAAPLTVNTCDCSGAASALTPVRTFDGGQAFEQNAPDAGAPPRLNACVASGLDAGPPRCSLRERVGALRVRFVNNCAGTAVRLLWSDWDCVEKPYALVPQSGTYPITTYVGHEWVVRDATTGQVLRRWASETTVDQTVPLCDCP